MGAARHARTATPCRSPLGGGCRPRGARASATCVYGSGFGTGDNKDLVAHMDDIVRAVNGVGASPGDLVAILQALKAAGALRAQLIVI